MDGSAIICDRKNEKSTRFIREEPLVLKDDFFFLVDRILNGSFEQKRHYLLQNAK